MDKYQTISIIILITLSYTQCYQDLQLRRQAKSMSRQGNERILYSSREPIFHQEIENINLNDEALNQQIMTQIQNTFENMKNPQKIYQEILVNDNKIQSYKQNLKIARLLQESSPNYLYVKDLQNEYHNTINDGSIYQLSLKNLVNQQQMMSSQIYQEKNQNDVSSVQQIISSLRVSLDIQKEKKGQKDVLT